jgi:hypothetical protein
MWSYVEAHCRILVGIRWDIPPSVPVIANLDSEKKLVTADAKMDPELTD